MGRGGTVIIIVQTRILFKVNLFLMKTVHTENTQILYSAQYIFIKLVPLCPQHPDEDRNLQLPLVTVPTSIRILWFHLPGVLYGRNHMLGIPRFLNSLSEIHSCHCTRGYRKFIITAAKLHDVNVPQFRYPLLLKDIWIVSGLGLLQVVLLRMF